MKTIKQILDEYEARGHELERGLQLTNGKITWYLERTTGVIGKLALRCKSDPGHYIGCHSLEYVIIPNLRIAPRKIKVFKMLYKLPGEENPKVTESYWPDTHDFEKAMRNQGVELDWARKIKECSKIVEFEC